MRTRLLWILVLCVGLAGLSVFFFFSRGQDNFDRWMTVGAGYLEKGDATNAISAYDRAAKLEPDNVATHLNLANAYLLADSNQAAIVQSQQAANLDRNNAAAYYLMGCAYLHLNQATQA